MFSQIKVLKLLGILLSSSMYAWHNSSIHGEARRGGKSKHYRIEGGSIRPHILAITLFGLKGPAIKKEVLK